MNSQGPVEEGGSAGRSKVGSACICQHYLSFFFLIELRKVSVAAHRVSCCSTQTLQLWLLGFAAPGDVGS